jgi:MFS family permease
MQRIAQDWLVLELTHNNGVALGVTTGLQFLPMLLIGPYAGSLADRYSKRHLLMGTQAFMGVVGAILGVLVITDIVRVWQVFLLALLLGVGAAVDAPARQSFVIEMVGPDDVPNAVGLNSASFNLGRVIGPGLAGFLIVLFGTGPVFLINAVSYVAVIFALRAMRPEDLQPAPRSSRGKGQVLEGIRYVRNRPDLMLVMVIVFFVGTFGLNFQMTSALMATEVFDKGAGEYGLLGSILAVGSLSGALLAARRGRPRLRLVVLAAVAFGLVEIVAGLMPSYGTFILVLIPIGLAQMTLLNAANSTVQLRVDPVMRGRVMALYMAVLMGGTPIGAPLVGVVAEAFGPRWSLIAGGLISASAAVIAAALLARREGLPMRPRLLHFPQRAVVDSPEELADRAQQA